MKHAPSEWLQAIRYALGADDVQIGNNQPLWIAAARARAPWADDQQLISKWPQLGPDAAEAARLSVKSGVRKSGEFTFYDVEIECEPKPPETHDPLFVTVTFFSRQALDREHSYELGGFAGRTAGSVRWTATIWPLARESFFSASVVTCFSNLDWSEAEWQNRSMLEPLIQSRTPLRYAGLYLLTGMLAAKEPGESGLATDIVIRAIEDGRLGSDNLGRGLSRLLVTGIIKPGRWQKSLEQVARASKVHAAVVWLALQSCFENVTQELPKDTARLLELLYELTLELGVPLSNQACCAWLSGNSHTGKTAKLAKSLLAIHADEQTQSKIQDILQQAIVARSLAAR